MANPLQTTPPIAPLQTQQQDTAPQAAPSQGAQGAGAPQPAGPPPPPSHDQTVAALRHFHAIREELEVLRKNPNLGRADIKSAIIDGATKLVATRIITPGQAVMQLGQVPENPLDQRKWIEQQLASAIQAADMIVDHHRTVGPGSQDFATEFAASQSSPDKHLETMSGVMGHYSGRRHG